MLELWLGHYFQFLNEIRRAPDKIIFSVMIFYCETHETVSTNWFDSDRSIMYWQINNFQDMPEEPWNHKLCINVAVCSWIFWSLIGIFSEILLLPKYFCWWKLSEFHSKLVLIIWKRNCICYESVRFVLYNAAVSDLAKYISVKIILFFMNTSLLKTSRIY